MAKKRNQQEIKTAGSNGRRDAIEFLVRKAIDSNVKFIRIWFTDILGFLKSFAITIDDLEKSLRDGVGFDGSSIESFARDEEHDMIAMPDLKTFQVLPWRPKENAVARMFVDILNVDGTPFEGDPRYCLRRQLKKAARQGFTFYVGPEIEYFYFRSSEDPSPLDKGGYFDLTPLDAGSDLRRETVLTLEDMNIPIHSSHHEVAPSQHEIDLRYQDALTTADNTLTFRLVVKEIALKHGLYATFMPKPIEDQNGSGMHVHQSLFHGKNGDVNAFFDKKDKYNLSLIARSYTAGLLKYAREMSIVMNQWPNSYKRLVSGYEAPTNMFWAQRNRLALVRIPIFKANKPESSRVEFRSPDAACNPYLAYSLMLAAGLQGIQKHMKLPDAVETRDIQTTLSEGLSRTQTQLPTNLGEAIQIAEESDFLREVLGDHIYESLIENKHIEWDLYRRHISRYELSKDLPTL